MSRYLQDWVTRQSTQRPTAIAVILRDQVMTYRELDTLSTQLAHAIQAAGLKPGARVCMLIPKSPLAIVALLATYKAGCLYVPLDWESPAVRTASIISSADPEMILAAGPVQELLGELEEAGDLAGIAIAWLDSQDALTSALQHKKALSRPNLDASPIEPVTVESRPDAAHLLFTSGSTGTPKGVIVNHQSVIDYVQWSIEHFGIDRYDRVSGYSPLHFDLSVFDIFGAFSVGAQLHLVPDDLRIRPDRLAAWMREQRLTQWFSVPAVFTYMSQFDVLRQGDFPDMKRIMWCGEVLPLPSLIYWMRRVPHVQFTNLYGPTETTIASSYFTVKDCPDESVKEIPIGRPCAGEELLVLDNDMKPVANNVTGDLYIKGAGLSPGYWRNREATDNAFIQDENGERLYRTGDLARTGADGEIYFKGRADSQFKSRGYRIELGEIEATLARIEVLRESAVVAIPSSGFDGTVICCSYVPTENGEASPSTGLLRELLGKELPYYMIPSRWQEHAELPRNGSGKIDRRYLKEKWLVMDGNSPETQFRPQIKKESNHVA